MIIKGSISQLIIWIRFSKKDMATGATVFSIYLFLGTHQSQLLGCSYRRWKRKRAISPCGVWNWCQMNQQLNLLSSPSVCTQSISQCQSNKGYIFSKSNSLSSPISLKSISLHVRHLVVNWWAAEPRHRDHRQSCHRPPVTPVTLEKTGC